MELATGITKTQEYPETQDLAAILTEYHVCLKQKVF